MYEIKKTSHSTSVGGETNEQQYEHWFYENESSWC